GLVGTDAVKGAAQSARTSATSTASSAGQKAAGAAQTASGKLTSTAYNGAATVSTAARGTMGVAGTAARSELAVAGSAASSLSGSVPVKPGMVVRSVNGQRLGKVRQVVADSSGRVQSLVVRAGQSDVTVPASTVTGSATGSGLVAANLTQ
ncbi:MAG TPA: hypothetical protein VN222_09825, partial [Novosphingobium sp.]|nr:hypothetical protein [Novosphingobium sp.]